MGNYVQVGQRLVLGVYKVGPHVFYPVIILLDGKYDRAMSGKGRDAIRWSKTCFHCPVLLNYECPNTKLLQVSTEWLSICGTRHYLIRQITQSIINNNLPIISLLRVSTKVYKYRKFCQRCALCKFKSSPYNLHNGPEVESRYSSIPSLIYTLYGSGW
jgi:hypothetical protein